jgi:hypothetical protein
MAEPDYFVALTECHFMNPQTMSEIDYYPLVGPRPQWRVAGANCRRPCPLHG